MLSSSRQSHRSPKRKAPVDVSDSESTISTCSTSSDDEDVNYRVTLNWCSYRHVIHHRGFRLDTCRDVKQLYQRYWEGLVAQGCRISKDLPGYVRACRGRTDELCPDLGLPENLFRGSRCSDGLPVVVKAVHLHSREHDIVQYLSTPPMRDHYMNHCIPILDQIEIPKDKLAFIVMEEWSPHLVTDPMYTLRSFLGIVHQHLEHITFMHTHRIAHLDISIRNVLTDSKSRYACIDFELSRRFQETNPWIRCPCSTEPPPEVDRGECCDPFKTDVWATGVLVLRAAQLTGYEIPELLSFAAFLLNEDAARRPTARQALSAYNSMFRAIEPGRLDGCEM